MYSSAHVGPLFLLFYMVALTYLFTPLRQARMVRVRNHSQLAKKVLLW